MFPATNRLARFAIVALSLAVGLPMTLHASYQRVYELRALDRNTAESWIWDICEKHRSGDSANCSLLTPPGNAITLVADAAVHADVTRMLAERDIPLPPQTFQLVLVTGTLAADGIDPQIPAASRAALEDLADLLPFRSFQLIDFAWLRTSQGGSVRLFGDGARFEATFRSHSEQERDRRIVQIPTFVLRSFAASDLAEASESETSETAPRAPGLPATLLETSLTMDVGETAVLGTSRLNGGKEALIVLLTAVADKDRGTAEANQAKE